MNKSSIWIKFSHLAFLLIASNSIADESTNLEYLSLNSCIIQGLKSNPEMDLERINVEISENELLKEKGALSWELETISKWEDRDKPQNTREFIAVGGISFPGNSARIFSDKNFIAKEGLKKKFKSGTIFELSSTFNRLENTLNQTSESSLYSPEYESFTGVTLIQPLLKGGINSTTAKINIANNQVKENQYLVEIKAINLIGEVSSSYTDIILIDEIIKLKEESILLAETLVKENKKLSKASKRNEIDTTTAELAVFNRKGDLFNSQAIKTNYLNKLFGLLDLPPASQNEKKFKPLENFFSVEEISSRKKITEIALKKRIDILYYNNLIKSSELNLIRAKDQSLPSLNLSGSYGAYGISDKGIDSYSESFKRQGMEWSVGLNFKMLLNKKARESEIRVAQNQLAKVKIEKEKAMKLITLQIDSTYDQLKRLKQKIKTSDTAVKLATQRLNQEQKLVSEGKGNIYKLVEQQELMTMTKIKAVEAQAMLNKSIISLWISSGEIFEKLDVDKNLIQ